MVSRPPTSLHQINFCAGSRPSTPLIHLGYTQIPPTVRTSTMRATKLTKKKSTITRATVVWAASNTPNLVAAKRASRVVATMARAAT